MYGRPELIPIVMFGWLALNLIVGWHKGAVLRGLVRQWRAENAPATEAKKRVAPATATASAPPRQQVRVHTTDLGPEEVIAGTEIQESGAEGRRRRKR
jgi:hypothetical protein